MSSIISAPSLTGPPDNVDNSAMPDQVQDTLSSDKNKPNTAEGNESEQRTSTVSATAKPLGCGAKESADVLHPLGSVIGDLSDVEGGEPSQINSYLHSEVGVENAVEAGLGREESDVGGKEATPVDGPPTPTPSILQGGKPNGM